VGSLFGGQGVQINQIVKNLYLVKKNLGGGTK